MITRKVISVMQVELAKSEVVEEVLVAKVHQLVTYVESLALMVNVTFQFMTRMVMLPIALLVARVRVLDKSAKEKDNY
jgi:hypothetical protein